MKIISQLLYCPGSEGIFSRILKNSFSNIIPAITNLEFLLMNHACYLKRKKNLNMTQTKY